MFCLHRLLSVLVLVSSIAVHSRAEPSKVDSLLPIQEGSRYGFINVHGEVVVPPRFREIGTFQDGLCAVRQDDRWGYIDARGNYVIQPVYNFAFDFSEGLARVWTDSVMQYIDHQGRLPFTLPPGTDGEDFKNGRAEISSRIKGQLTRRWIDRTGQVIVRPDTSVLESPDGGPRVIYYHATAKNPAGYAIVDRRGRTIVRRGVYCRIDRFVEGLAKVCLPETEKDPEGAAGFIDTNGKLVYSLPKYYYNILKDGYSGGLIEVKIRDTADYESESIDRNGNYVWKTVRQAYRAKNHAIVDTLNIDHQNSGYCHFQGAAPRLRGELISALQNPRSLPFAKRRRTADPYRLEVRPHEAALFQGKYAGFSLYLQNVSNDTVIVDTEAGLLYLKMQARDAGGQWRDIDFLPNYSCGNAIQWNALLPGEIQRYALPVYQGSYRTQLRVALKVYRQWNKETGKSEDVWLYSEAFEGHINPGQFWRRSRSRQMPEVSLFNN